MRRTVTMVWSTTLVLLAAFLLTGSPAVAATPGEDCALHGTIELARTVDERTPVGTGRCGGVRPGGFVTIDRPDPDDDAGCTFNFVVTGFEELDDGTTIEHRFIGTAGHCVLADPGERTWQDDTGPLASIWEGGTHIASTHTGYEEVEVGRVVYAVDQGVPDFALIELDDDVEADPRMCHWGGPTGVDPGPRDGAEFVRHSGHGMVWSWVTPGRTGYADSWDEPDLIYFRGVGDQGDSGSPLIVADSGHAAGVIVGMAVGGGIPGSFDVAVVATRFEPQMERAAEQLGLEGWELETAPLGEATEPGDVLG